MLHFKEEILNFAKAELESSPLLEESVCNGCRACADACPLGAISKTETEEITICGKTFTVGKIDYDKCKICQNGAVANRFDPQARPDRIAALCNRTCMCGLEQREALNNKFVNTFRNPYYKRECWSLPLHPENPSKGVNPHREAYLDEKYPGIREGEYEKPTKKDSE